MNSETEDEDFPFINCELVKVAFDYIPRPILRNIDKTKIAFKNPYSVIDNNGVKCIQILIDSNNQHRMYGTAKELADNLKIYRNFPFRHKVFHFDAATPYIKKLTEFRSLKGEIFVRKDSFLRYCHTIIYGKYKIAEKTVPSELLKYMKNQEKQFYKCYEFMRYNSDVFDRKYQSEDEIDLQKFKIMINDETNIENTPIVIRIFEDGPEKFVMKLELSRLNKYEDVDENTLKHETKNGILYTMELNEVFKTFRNQMNKIEFIRIPITRAKHAAVPIVTPSGDHCILAADVLLELLRRLISALNIFQKVNTDIWETVTNYISLLESKFPFNVECKYFIDLNVYNDMKRETDEFWKEYDNVPVKLVRDVGKEGFTVDDLKEELKYLGLTDIFLEIANHAENVYTEIVRDKRVTKLRTCDMFDALEKCQLICILNRFPNLKKILHSQKACHRVPLLRCEPCSIDTKNVRIEANEKVMKFYNTSLDVNTENDKESIPEHSQNGGETLSDNVTTTKDSIKTLNASEDKKTECEEMRDKESEISSNDSNCCPNCQQFNKVLNETNEELRLTRIELEDAEKNEKINQKMIEEYAESSMNQKIVTNRMIEKAEIVTRQLTEQASDFKKCKEELDKIVVSETKLKESNKKLTEKNRSLEQEINRLKQKTTADQKASISMKNQLEKEISDNRKINNEITEKNKGLEEELIRLKEKATADQMQMRTSFEKKIADNEGTNNEFIETNRKLGQSIVHLHQKIEKDQMENAKQQSRLEKEISENKRINIELQKDNSCLSIQNEIYEKSIRTLTDRLAAVPSAPSGPVDTKKDNETPSGMRFQLVGFQKIKDSLRKKNPLKQAEDMVEKLLTMTNRPEIQQLANYELMQFEGKFRNYSQTVEMNIQKLKDSGHCKDLSPLPEFPAFSEKFMKEYCSEMEKQPSTSSEKPSAASSATSSELADSECLICTDPMESIENTIKCETCKRRFHSTCASEWLKRKSVCPACSRGLLDPSEYPSLG